MSKVFLTAGKTGYEVANLGDSFYGSTGTESVSINSNVTGIIVDSNMESVTLTGAMSTYSFQQAGNVLSIYTADGVTLVTSMAIGDLGSTLIMNSVSYHVAVEADLMMKIGDEKVGVQTLTTGTDTLTGTVANDRFDGLYGTDGSTVTYTLQAADVLNGGAGIDTLKVTTAAEASTPLDGLWAGKTNFEKIAFDSTGAGAQTITTGANFATAFATGADVSVETFDGAITLDMSGYTQATTVNTTTHGASSAQTITTGTGAASVTATALVGGAQTISGVNLNTVHATVLGAGAQTITSTSTSAVTVVADAFNGAQTITTGTGNDHVTTTSTAGTINVITTGAGDDVIVASLGSDTITGGAGVDIMTGGSGTDTFLIAAPDTGITLATADTITDFTAGDVINATSIVGGATIVDGSGFANFDAFVAAANAVYTVNTAAYIAYNAANSGDAWVLLDHDNSDSVTTGDSIVVLSGVNTAAKIDVVAPTILSAAVSGDGRSIVITHSEVLTGAPEAADYGVTLSAGTTAVTGATLGAGADANKITITLSNTIATGLTVTNLVHTATNGTADSIQDTATVANKAATQTLATVTNSSAVVASLLTIGTDNLTGTSANDTFDATYGNATTVKTIQAEDILNGGNGTDTVNIVTGAEASTPGDGLWTNKTNFEKVVFSSTGDGAQTIVTDVNFLAAFANGADVSVETQVGAINLNMGSYTHSAAITTSSIGDGVHTILTGSGATTVNATSHTAGDQTINGAGLTTVDALIVGAGVQTIGTTAGQSIVTVNATIQGDGAQTITSTSASAVTVVANAFNGVQTIVTGAGNDSVTTTSASGVNNTISTLAGDDVIVASAGNDTITGGLGKDTMTGGAGRDIFVFAANDTGTTLATADIITDFSAADDIIQAPSGALIIANGAALNFTTFSTAANAAFAGGSTNDDKFIAYNAAGTGNAWVAIDHNNDGTLDSVAVLNGVDVENKLTVNTLTIGTDTITGTALADTFDATYGNASTIKTIQAEDVLDGGNGIDTVNIVTGAEASTPPDGLWTNKTNFEKVVFSSTGDGVQTIVTDANFAAAFATGADLSVETQAGAINVDMSLYAQASTITTSSIGAGVHTIVTGSVATTVNATSHAAGAQTINGAGLTTVNATIVGAGVQTIGTTAGQSIVTVNATIQGDGAQQITSTSASNVTVVANAHNGVQTIVTGAGDDSVTTTSASGVDNTIVTYAGIDTIVAGAGNDTITAGIGKDTMTGGAGRDIFVFATGDTGTTLATADIITDFSSEDIIQAPAGSLIITNGSALADFAAFSTAANTAFGGGATTDDKYVAYNAAGTGDAWVAIDHDNDGTLDSVAVLSGVNLASKITDVVAPAILSAEVATDGRSIIITHSEVLTGTPEAGDYGVTLSGGSTTSVTGATLGTGADANKITLTLSNVVLSTLNVTDLVYTSSAGVADSIKDAAATSNKATTQTLASVTNNSANTTYALTLDTDTLTGSAAADTFDGTFGVGVATTYTLGVADVLDGGAGIDTLNVTTLLAEANSPTDALWANKTNFEKIVFNSLGDGAQTITTGANFTTAFATGADFNVQTLLGAITVDMTGYLQAATIHTTTIGTGAHTITTGTGVASVTALSTTDGSQTMNGVGLTTVNATINGAGDQTIGTTTGANIVTVNATILGVGAQTITSTSASAVTVVAHAVNGAQTIITGAGNDSVTTTSAAGTLNAITTNVGDDIIVASLGDDTIIGGGGVDTMTGGLGADTFAFGAVATGITLATADTITDFTTADDVITTTLSEGAAVTIVDGSALVSFAAFLTDAAAVFSAGAYIAYNVMGTGDAWFINDEDSTSSVTVNDTLIILTGVNLVGEIVIGDIA
ncbi:MAG: calcium-binding protein [Sulfurimonas sp.]|jgi:Ca2+-binding RTX toxin-like protein